MSYKFRLSQHKTKHLEWDKVLYFDVETAKYNEPFDEYGHLLDIRSVGITAFTVRIPASLLNKRKLAQLQAMVQVHSTTIDGVDFVDCCYYDEQRTNTRNKLLFVLDTVATGLRYKTYLCGFNNDRFDDLIILDRLTENVNCWQYHLANGEPTKLYTTDLLHWAKSYGLHTLEELGDYLSVPKLAEWTTIDEYMEYNRRDVDILTRFVMLMNTHGMYALRPASEARNMMSRILLQKLQPINRIFSDQQISDSVPLFGGRTEPYYAYGKDLQCLDVNSLYPYAMSTFLYPEITPTHKDYAEIVHSTTACTDMMKLRIYEFLDHVGDYIRKTAEQYICITPDMLRQYFEDNSPWFGVLRVKLHGIRPEWKEYEQQILFYFPFARHCEGYTLYSFDPDAEYSVQFYELIWLTFFDFDIIDGIEFPYRAQLPVSDYIKQLYAIRKQAKEQGDPIERAYKLLLNSGYGIWATRNRSTRTITQGQQEYATYYNLWQQVQQPEFDIIDGKDTISVFAHGNPPEFRVQYGNPDQRYRDNTIPIFAVATTSHGRFVLYSYMLNAVLVQPEIRCDNRVFYVDTDSLFCSAALAEHLQPCIGPELGQLKVEQTYSECLFLAPKSYIGVVPNDPDPIKRFKGTGPQFVRRIVQQSKTTPYREYVRVALDPSSPQKRSLAEDWVFYPTPQPEPGTEYLAQLLQFAIDKYDHLP